jgi:hypothetical protein
MKFILRQSVYHACDTQPDCATALLHRNLLLVGPQHIDLPVFNSTLLHADAAVEFFTMKQGQRPRAAQGVPS